jgi:hypothetical protein
MTTKERQRRRWKADLNEIAAIVTTEPEKSWLWLAAVAQLEVIEREMDRAG